MAKSGAGRPRTKPPRSQPAGKTGMIRARVAPELKQRVEGILTEVGLTPSDAIRLFYTQVALRNGLPFDVEVPNATTRRMVRDAAAGRGRTRYDSVDAMRRDLGY